MLDLITIVIRNKSGLAHLWVGSLSSFIGI